MRAWAGMAGMLWLVAGCATVNTAPRLERVVFASVRDGNTDLYLINADGTGLRRLTQHPSLDQFPRCSPDGRAIVFVRGEKEARDLVIHDLATGAETRLTHDGVADSTPIWSADGRHIYFTRREGSHDRIAEMGRDGSALRFLTGGDAHDTMPGASPDGRTLVHHTYRYGRDTELQLIDLASGQSRRLTTAPASDYEASFAGDDHILFSSNRAGGHYRLYRAAAHDGAAELLADTGADAWGPRHSSRTEDILFYTGATGSWRLMRAPLRGGSPAPLLADGFSNFGADWCAPAD